MMETYIREVPGHKFTSSALCSTKMPRTKQKQMPKPSGGTKHQAQAPSPRLSSTKRMPCTKRKAAASSGGTSKRQAPGL